MHTSTPAALRRSLVAIALVLVGCGRDTPAPIGRDTPAPTDVSELKLVLPTGSQVHVHAGETATVVFSAIGSQEPASYAVEPMPRFATLDGALLRLAPTRSDAGEFDLAVTATAGQLHSMGTLRVVVQRPNAPPELVDVPPDSILRGILYSDHTGALTSTMPGAGRPNAGENRLFFHRTLSVTHWASDRDGDPVHLEAEVVPVGTPLRGVPTHVSSSMTVDVPDLPIGEAHRIAIRAVDAFGAASAWLERGDEAERTPIAIVVEPAVCCLSPDRPLTLDVEARGADGLPAAWTAAPAPGAPVRLQRSGSTLTIVGDEFLYVPEVVNVEATSGPYVARRRVYVK